MSAATTPFAPSVPTVPDYMGRTRLTSLQQLATPAAYLTEAEHLYSLSRTSEAPPAGEEMESSSSSASSVAEEVELLPPLAATPTPAALTRLSPYSPYLAALLGNDAVHYYGDGLPRAASLLTLWSTNSNNKSAAPTDAAVQDNSARVVAPQTTQLLASGVPSNVFTSTAVRFGAVKDPIAYYSKADAAGAYESLRRALVSLPPLSEEVRGEEDASSQSNRSASTSTDDSKKGRRAVWLQQQRQNITELIGPFRYDHTDRFVFASGQVALALTDRLVRLSPSATKLFRGVLAEGVRSAAGADVTANTPLPGVLHRSGGLPSSIDDAASGNWNMSDLPPWLRIPSFVNPTNCLDPPNIKQRLATLDKKSIRRTASDGGGSEFTRQERYQPGDDAYEAPRSVLFFGPSHSRNHYSSLCTQYANGARRNALRRGTPNAFHKSVAELSELCQGSEGKHGTRILTRGQVFGEQTSFSSSSSSLKPFPMVFAWNSFSPFRNVERLAATLLEALEKEEAERLKRRGVSPNSPSPTVVARKSRAVKHRASVIANTNANDVVREMARVLPLFTTAVGDASNGRVRFNDTNQKGADGGVEAGEMRSDEESFAYSNFFLRHRRGDFAPLRGLFTHIIVSSGVWETVFKDATVAEHTEDTAITLDLLEEIFSPEKIIIYNPHRWWPTGADTIEKDATGDLTRGLMAKEDSCNAPHSLAKYRDAHLCAAYGPTRARVRRAWVEEFAAIQRRANDGPWGPSSARKTNVGITKSVLPVAPPPLKRANEEASSKSVAEVLTPPTRTSARQPAHGHTTVVEVFDPFGATSQPVASMFADPAGHHYRLSVQDALVQRMLRDHVCPPRYVLAVRPPAGEGNEDEDDKGMAAGGLHEDRPPVNYAASNLPWRFPFPPGVDRVIVPVLTSRDSADRMPSLSLLSVATHGNDDKQLNSPMPQFPLFKAPIPVVSEGLYRAIFDHPYAAVNSHTRAVRINTSHGLRADEEEVDGDDRAQSGWWRRASFGFSSRLGSAAAASQFLNAPPPPFKGKGELGHASDARSRAANKVTSHFPLDDARAAASLPPAFAPNDYNSRYATSEKKEETSTHVPPYLGTHLVGSPFFPNIRCLSHHPRRLIPSGARNHRLSSVNAVAAAFIGKNDSTHALSSSLSPSPLHPALAAAAVPLLTTPRHNIDPLYLLRTSQYYSGTDASRAAACALSRYSSGGGGATAMTMRDSGDAYAAHKITALFSIDLPDALFEAPYSVHMADGCAPQTHAELRGRMVVAAYLRAYTRDD